MTWELVHEPYLTIENLGNNGTRWGNCTMSFLDMYKIFQYTRQGAGLAGFQLIEEKGIYLSHHRLYKSETKCRLCRDNRLFLHARFLIIGWT